MNPLTRPPCRPENDRSLKNTSSTPALLLRSRLFYAPHSVSRAPARLARSMGPVSGIRKDPDALVCVESSGPSPLGGFSISKTQGAIMASTLQGVTAPKSLFHSDLCHIRAGIPAEEALQEASTFLASARNIAWAIQSENHSDLPYAAVCMIDLAKGLIDATLSGSIEKNQGQEEASDRGQLDVLERLVRFADEGVLLINPDADELGADEARLFLEWAQRKTAKGGAA